MTALEFKRRRAVISKIDQERDSIAGKVGEGREGGGICLCGCQSSTDKHRNCKLESHSLRDLQDFLESYPTTGG